jgi:hypothetical protein
MPGAYALTGLTLQDSRSSRHSKSADVARTKSYALDQRRSVGWPARVDGDIAAAQSSQPRRNVSLWGLRLDAHGIVAIMAAVLIVLVFAAVPRF